MQAAVYQGPGKIEVTDVANPTLKHPTDAILRLTSTALCGSDLHMYEGRTPMPGGRVLGHEPMGVLEEVGSAVQSFKKGDRVVVPFNISCGHCFNCIRGFPNACLTLNDKKASAGYGYVGMGPYEGAHAQYVRVPWADFNCMKLPGEAGDQWEDDFVLLADVFPTGFHATELAGVHTGSTVAIYGAGPVGLLATLSCTLKGAAQTFVVDDKPDRLHLVEKLGGIPVDFRKGEPAEQIKEMRRNDKGITGSWIPGEEKMDGVMCGIDAIGYEDVSFRDPQRQDPAQVITSLVEVVNATGRIGQIGVFFPEDPGGVNEQAKHGVYPWPEGKLWEKGIEVGRGQAPVNRYNRMLRDVIVAGKAKPSMIVSQRLPLSEAPRAYENFDKRLEGWTKVVFKPEQRVA
jgi:glutathione-independent formaldehyde dehydrogenase